MRYLTLLTAVMGLTVSMAHAGMPTEGTLYKNPNCGCCDAYAEYLEENGFKITLQNTNDMAQIKKMADVPDALVGCHTMRIGNYVVEGLVPVDTLKRLLTEEPDIRGISLPGMPTGAPGMPGPKPEPFKIYTISAEPEVYAEE
ncbi:DUF411 domain-containing protein [Chelativorans intermedius]|uniref:DUF411 domain-containing protein n=1 Tax=Chelativorans intermedius TaxID=515947 RepID=A0ABV6DBD4_9HYPH|nr:DUF411 domain-containing protein [Chelativorans intermedius]MCT9000276.1 CopG family transcriptional regulator [Chelativorans intermedius]